MFGRSLRRIWTIAVSIVLVTSLSTLADVQSGSRCRPIEPIVDQVNLFDSATAQVPVRQIDKGKLGKRICSFEEKNSRYRIQLQLSVAWVEVAQFRTVIPTNLAHPALPGSPARVVPSAPGEAPPPPVAQDLKPVSPAGDRAAGEPSPSANADDLNALNQQFEQLYRAGKYAEAIELAQRALTVAERQFGPDDVQVGRALNNLAELYRAQGRNGEAEPLIKRAFTIDEKALGAEHPSVGEDLNNLAGLYREQSRYAEAEPLYKRALAIDEKALGPNHPEVGTDLNNLAGLYRAQGRYVEAEPLYKRALAIAEKATPAGDHPPAVLPTPPPPLPSELPQGGGLDLTSRSAPPQSPPVSAPEGPTAETVVPCATRGECTPITIFYGTDRRRNDTTEGVAYSGDRAGRLELGKAIVTVPRSARRAAGEITLPQWWEVKLGLVPPGGDPKKHFVVLRNGFKIYQSETDFLSAVKSYMTKASWFKKEAFIFVHGYNTPFDDALFRVAQLAYDLGRQNSDGSVEPFGTPFLYSWPSGGWYSDYIYDSESARLAVDYLRSFIELVIQETGAEHVHIIAHSMGNFALVHALQEIATDQRNKSRIDQIILAAPDIDAAEFRSIAEKISPLAKGYTLYASSNDVAMQASRKAHKGFPRAGDVPESGPIVVGGIDTLEISSLSTAWFSFNHNEYVEEKVLLNDVAQLLRNETHPPNDRDINYHPKPLLGLTYWYYGQAHQ
jgi:esterase/lipase superfamily enzyme